MTDLPIRGAEVLQALLEEEPLQSSDFVAPGDSKTTTDYNYTLRQLEDRDLVELVDGQRGESGGNAPNVAHLTERGRNRARELSEGEETVVKIQKADDKLEEMAAEIASAQANARAAGSSSQRAIRRCKEVEDEIKRIEEQLESIEERVNTYSGNFMQRIEKLETGQSGVSKHLEENFGKTIADCAECYYTKIGEAGQSRFVCDDCA